MKCGFVKRLFLVLVIVLALGYAAACQAPLPIEAEAESEVSSYDVAAEVSSEAAIDATVASSDVSSQQQVSGEAEAAASTPPVSSKEQSSSSAASSKVTTTESSSAPAPKEEAKAVASAAPADVEEALPNVFIFYVAYWPTNVNVVELLDCENFYVSGAAFNYVEYAESDNASISFSWKGQSLTCTVTEPGDYFITIECTSKVTGRVVYRDTIMAFG